MRMYNKLFFALFAMFAGGFAHDANSAQPFSQYGQIQNVQNYSSNPFWNPNGPYNQRMPQAIYVDGPEINAGDCQRTVSALVANVCATMNNCVGAQLSDVRPTLMLQLSQLPGHNYATSCAGYIDSEFDNYVKKYGHAGVSSGAVAFPDATAPSNTDNTIEIKNPYETPIPQWQQDVIERTQELEELQASNGGNMGDVAKADFPTTFADLSFEERLNIKAEGYEPYKDAKAYNSIKVVNNGATTSMPTHVTIPPISNNDPTTQPPDNSTPGATTDPDTSHLYAIFVYDDGTKKIGDSVKLIDINEIYWDKKCSDHVIAFDLNNKAAINRAGQSVFTEKYKSESTKKLSNPDSYEYFLDFEEGNKRRIFPGLLILETGRASIPPSTEMLVFSSNKDKLTDYAKQFATKLKDTACQNLYVYVADLHISAQSIERPAFDILTKELLRQFGVAYLFLSEITYINEIEIVSEPYAI